MELEGYSRPTSGAAGPLAARGGGQICRPFVMCDVMLPKERTDGIGGLDGIIRYRPAPTQSWRNTNKVEPDAAKDPML